MGRLKVEPAAFLSVSSRDVPRAAAYARA
eukprot:COSAG01_NODE_70917_length_257_cov_0.949367_1_plen_28_part_10